MEMSPWCPPSCCWRLQPLPPKQPARLPKSWDLFGTSESPGTIIHENTRNIHIPRWKSPITWENSWHAITLLCAWIQIDQDILLMMWGYMSSLWCSLHWYETTRFRSALCPRTTYTQQGNQQHISSAITLTSCSCLFFVPRHPMMDSNNLLDPLCHTKWSNQENNTEWSPNMNQICILMHLHEHQYSRLGVVCAFVTGTYPNMKSGCYHHLG